MKAYMIKDNEEYIFLDTLVNVEKHSLVRDYLLNNDLVTNIVISFVKDNIDIPFTIYINSIENVLDFMLRGRYFTLADNISEMTLEQNPTFTKFIRPTEDKDLSDLLQSISTFHNSDFLDSETKKFKHNINDKCIIEYEIDINDPVNFDSEDERLLELRDRLNLGLTIHEIVGDEYLCLDGRVLLIDKETTIDDLESLINIGGKELNFNNDEYFIRKYTDDIIFIIDKKFVEAYIIINDTIYACCYAGCDEEEIIKYIKKDILIDIQNFTDNDLLEANNTFRFIPQPYTLENQKKILIYKVMIYKKLQDLTVKQYKSLLGKL